MVTGQDNMTKSNINILSNLKLSVQVSLNGLSFCILDTLENNIVLLKEIIFDSSKNPLEVEQELINAFKKSAINLGLSLGTVLQDLIHTILFITQNTIDSNIEMLGNLTKTVIFSINI